MSRFSSSLVFILGLSISSCSTLFPGSGSSSGSGTAPVSPTGCAATPTEPVAPGGYYVHGNTVCTTAGHAHLFHGVDRPSLEWSSSGVNLSPADFLLMASWKANVVRIALNQDFWIAASPYYDPNYSSQVDSAIAWAEEAGMDAILDLHWSDTGTLGACDPTPPLGKCQQKMADANSTTFWSEVAARYANDGRVLFELYNEPHDVSWPVWKSGGSTGSGWTAVGMQQLYDAVRAAGANNLVVIGGLDWAYDLSGVPSSRIAGYNILYATHPYNNGTEKKPAAWDQSWGFLTATDPVIVTEFGDSATTCSTTYSSQVISYADQHNASWTAWAWYAKDCTFPSLITDWSATPSAVGMVVKTALGGYNDPAAPPRDAGTSDAGPSASDAGPAPGDAASSASDAGPTTTDAGPAPSDRGPPVSDAGPPATDAGS